MLWKIFLFEVQYRLNRRVTYVYFGIVFLISFLVVTSPTAKLAGAVGNVYANAPYVISVILLLFSVFMPVITAAVMGVAVVRDYDHGFDSLLFTTRVRKLDYLMGRFLGSFFVMVFIACGAWLGLVAGYSLGDLLPWNVVWKSKAILPLYYWHYLQPFVLLTVTNLFISGTFFFISGALGRNSIVIYTQGAVLLLLYQMGARFLQDMDTRALAVLVDPFGVQAFLDATQYWSPEEKNTRLVSFGGLMLYNKVIWLTVSVGALMVTISRFSAKVSAGGRLFLRRGRVEKAVDAEEEFVTNPRVSQRWDRGYAFWQVVRGAGLYFRMVIFEIPFIAIVGCGFLVFVINALKVDEMYGTSSHPTTYAVLGLFNSFSIFFVIIAIFYAGELLWSDRSRNFSQLTDALPVTSLVNLLSKFLGLVGVYVVLMTLLLLAGVVVQVSYGYYRFDLGVYAGTLFLGTLSSIILFTVLSFFIQGLVANKFMGFVLTIVLVMGLGLVINAGVESDLILFGSGSLNVYSDMNGYGHFVVPFAWLRVYWLFIAVILFFAAVVFWVRGSATTLRSRWRNGLKAFTGRLRLLVAGSVLVTASVGGFIYYNVYVLNGFKDSGTLADERADYERIFQRYDSVTQPKVVEVNLRVALFPYDRDFTVEGFYYLKNESRQPIRDVHIQLHRDRHVTLGSLEFGVAAKLKKGDDAHRYYIYELGEALGPGDSVKMTFALSFSTRGFEGRGSNTRVVYNGTYLDQSFFPSIGYDRGAELVENEERTARALGAKKALRAPGEEGARDFHAVGDHADRIRFEAVVSTAGDQTVVAPGTLEKFWSEGGRNYFHYKMAQPIVPLYSVLSGRYRVQRDRWNDVELEVYFHPGHPGNVSVMMESVKDALAYCSVHFGPYPFGHVRIVEFPRYTPMARSFAGTIPFSEGIGFILDVRDPGKDLDMVYYVTAHEAAHQWWGQQVVEARALGGRLLSESLAQYSALMILKREVPPEALARYLRYELNGYLTGRSAERRRELPLVQVEDQVYVHYSKAALVFFALQDYLGEERLNEALRAFRNEWAFHPAPYPTSLDLVKHIRRVTPDSLQYLVSDLFEHITLYENKVTEVIYEEVATGKFEVTLGLESKKVQADSLGRETELPLDEWIDIGVYAASGANAGKLIYLQKHKITQRSARITVVVSGKPGKAGIDPLYKLIDRHADDNVLVAKKVVELGSVPLLEN